MSVNSSIQFVTYPMFLDALHPCTVLQPKKPPHRLRWASSINWSRGPVSESDLVLVCKMDAAHEASARYPQALLVVIAAKDDERLNQMEGLPNPTLVVAEDSTSTGLLQRIQNFFLSIQSWSLEMTAAPSTPEGLAKVLNSSGRLVEASLFLYDNQFTKVSRGWVNLGSSLVKEYYKHERELLNRMSVMGHATYQLSEEHPSAHVVLHPIVTEGNALTHNLCALFDGEPTAGQMDFLDMLVAKLAIRTGSHLGSFEPSRFSLYTLLENLTQGKYVGAGQLADYSLHAHLPLDAEYRLMCIREKDGVEPLDAQELISNLQSFNSGECIVAVYNGNPCVLLYSKGMDNRLSNLTIEAHMSQILDPARCYIALSQVFEDILNLGLAYRQIELVSKYKDVIDFEAHFVVSEGIRPHLCYSFEEALRFAVTRADEMDQELRDFSFSHTIFEKIIEEDLKHGSNDAQILGCYIYHERKATVVAERLNIHRNTVLYRIKKIEDRFGINFDEGWARMRVMLDLAIYYSKFRRGPDMTKILIGSTFSDFIAQDPPK